MKKNKLTMGIVAGIAGVAGMANAQQYINPEGTGEVLIYPYYTVNNGINTLYSVVNTTADAKAVKVRFLEGENTVEVLDFNVYMSPFDVWTGGLVATDSTVPGNVGQPSAYHTTSDTSCAPYLDKARQEFLPFAIDASQAPFSGINSSLQRGTDGHIEVLEMAVHAGPAAAASLHGSDGVPANCAFFEAAWNDDSWTEDVDLATTGGLMGSAVLVNVNEGLAMTYDAVAVDGFWPAGVGSHTEPGNLSPSISNGDTSATVFNGGVATTSAYASGAEAISSLFIKQNIYNEYALDAAVAGKSEWVITFPTKNPHVNTAPLPVIPPFVNEWNGTTSCHEFTLSIYDREEQEEQAQGGTVSPEPPSGANPALCYEVNVVEFILPSGAPGATSSIFGSDNLVTVTTPAGAKTESGWANMGFISDSGTPYVDANGYQGLPVAGFAAQQFTNGGAADGLLAQYAGLFVHKGLVVSGTAPTR